MGFFWGVWYVIFVTKVIIFMWLLANKMREGGFVSVCYKKWEMGLCCIVIIYVFDEVGFWLVKGEMGL